MHVTRHQKCDKVRACVHAHRLCILRVFMFMSLYLLLMWFVSCLSSMLVSMFMLYLYSGEFQDVCFFNAELVFKHRRPAAFFLYTPDHFTTRDLLPFSEILNMPGIPELLVADSHCIGETITTKRSYDEAVGCRHLEWLPVLVTVSHVCPSLPGTGQRRKRLLNSIVRGIGVCSFNACKTFTLHAFKGFNCPSTATDEPGEWQVHYLSKSGAFSGSQSRLVNGVLKWICVRGLRLEVERGWWTDPEGDGPE